MKSPALRYDDFVSLFCETSQAM